MEFNNFEACVDDDGYNISYEDEVNFRVGKNNDFIDDSEEISENVCKYYRFANVTRSVTLRSFGGCKKFIESSIDLENSNDATNFCDNSDEEVPQIDDFDKSCEKVDKFETLLIPHGQGSAVSPFYSIYYAIRFLKSKKYNQFGDGEIKEVLGCDLYNLLYHDKDILQLSLDHQKFEKQCFRVNEILFKHGYFLRVFELKKKFYSLFTKNSEKQTIIRKVSSCITEKFNGFNIVTLEYGRKLRKKFKPIDIINKPIKKVSKKSTATFPGSYI